MSVDLPRHQQATCISAPCWRQFRAFSRAGGTAASGFCGSKISILRARWLAARGASWRTWRKSACDPMSRSSFKALELHPTGKPANNCSPLATPIGALAPGRACQRPESTREPVARAFHLARNPGRFDCECLTNLSASSTACKAHRWNSCSGPQEIS